MALKVHNSLTRQREAFVPLNLPRVGIYVCGPTVYGHSHLGHAKSYVSFDAIIRWLRFSGYEVNYIQNITDVGHLTDNADEGEDKVISEARRRGLHPMAVAEAYMQSYYEDMDALNILRPDIAPRATGHIPEQITAVQKLLENGHAYEVNGSVYFDVSSFPDYGKLSGRSVEEMDAGARVAVNPEKRQPPDFALWKRAEPGHIMRWPSPWGEGYPGWHLECSVMSQKYIGDTLDIHGGGIENQFPHHECEIAQGECCTGKPFARYWLHNNMCTLNGQKMGKSLGNAISLKEIFQEGTPLLEKAFEPVVIRHFVLTSHYRQPLDFSNEALKGAESGSCKLRDAARELSRAAKAAPSKPQSEQVRTALADIEKRFTDAMNEDFNTAAGIATIFELAKQSGEWIGAGVGQEDLLAADRLMQRLAGDALGFKWPAPSGGADEAKQTELIRALVDLRNDARQQRNFALGDQIRERLAALGVHLRDTPQGTVW
ncbi:MAG: cysteine--tRNA ligase [Phycisphaerae bacterium]